MRTRLSTYLAIALLATGWVVAMLNWLPDTVSRTITVLRHNF